ELDLAGAADVGEVRVLGEEPITRMNRLDITDLGGGDNPVNLEIALARGRVTDAHRLVGQLEIRCVLVRRRVDHDRLNAHLPAGADDPQGDFSAVGDEDLGEHRV